MSEPRPFAGCVDCRVAPALVGRLRCNPCQKTKDTGVRRRRPRKQLTFIEVLTNVPATLEWFTQQPVITADIEVNLVQLRQRVRKYGLTLERWATMVAQANSRCGICGTSHLPTALAIDHDHYSGHVRGLLCTRCNTGLGSLRIDGPEAVRVIDTIRSYIIDRTPRVQSRDTKIQVDAMMTRIRNGERLF